VPIVGDFHYTATCCSKVSRHRARSGQYRINPGNAEHWEKRQTTISVMVECAAENQKPVRIGVNWGSLDQSLLTRMMDENSKKANPDLPATS